MSTLATGMGWDGMDMRGKSSMGGEVAWGGGMGLDIGKTPSKSSYGSNNRMRRYSELTLIGCRYLDLLL